MPDVRTAARGAWDTIRGALGFVALFCVVAPLLCLACLVGLLDVEDEDRPETLGPWMEGDDV
jgi:hypothetical protein